MNAPLKAPRALRQGTAMGTELEHVGPALRRLRQLRDLTQADVAARSGCSKAQVSAYERSKRLPRVDTLLRLLAAMGWRFLDFARALDVRWRTVGTTPPTDER